MQREFLVCVELQKGSLFPNRLLLENSYSFSSCFRKRDIGKRNILFGFYYENKILRLNRNM